MNDKITPACYLQKIGTAVPQRWLAREQAGELLSQMCTSRRSARLLQRMVPLIDVEKRHLAVMDYQTEVKSDSPLYRPLADQPAGPGMTARNALFDEASRRLVKGAVRDFPAPALATIDTLITVSCTHVISPGLEQAVFGHTPVPTSVDRWNLGFMGCSAALAATRLIHRTAARGTHALIVACELSSLHFQYTDKRDQITANMLFSDGAAAWVLSPQRSAVRIIDCQCVTLPQAADQMVWFAGDHGLELVLSPDLPDTLGETLPAAISTFLQKNRQTTASVDHWLVHPGGPQILDRVEEALQLPGDSLRISRGVFRQYGNMSSPTILFILKEFLETKTDGFVVAMAFGPGLTIELVLLEVGHDRV